MLTDLETTVLIDTGIGSRTLVSLHGWCCRTGDFGPQVDALSDEFRLLVPDWQHRMMARQSGISFQSICEDVVQLIQERGIERPVLCGHSMGGMLAAYIAKSRMLPLSSVLMLDSLLPLPETVRESHLKLARELKNGPYRDIFETFCAEAFFLPDELGECSRSILSGMMSEPPEVAIGLLEEICSLEFSKSLSDIEVPLHMVASARGRLDLDSLRQYKPDATGETVDGVGHFLTVFAWHRISEVMRQAISGVPFPAGSC